MNQGVITLISDFGDEFAVSQIELVIHSINPNVRFIASENNITAFSTLEGAFILSKLYQFAPNGSIHMAVVDPEVGSSRKGLIIKTKHNWFIGPDNGILFPAAVSDEIEQCYSIKEKSVGSLSNTFHGRDIFAKVAALISINHPIDFYAEKCDVNKIRAIKFKKNQVAHIDPYGNIKLSTNELKYKIGNILDVKTAKKQVRAKYCQAFNDVSRGEFLLYKGSHQTLEIAVNLGSAASILGVKIGDVVKINNI